MPRMVMFRSNRECRDIAVNAEQVLWVCHYQNDACTLHFGKECFVRVQGEMADVVRKLQGGADDAVAQLPEQSPQTQGADLH